MLPSSIRILCVEDDEDSCELYRMLFKTTDERYRLTTARTAAEALELLTKEDYDLLMLDCWLPDKSGIELCRQLREFDSQMPVLFFTADARESVREKILEAGANAVLIKVEDLHRLVATAQALVEQKQLSSKTLP